MDSFTVNSAISGGSGGVIYLAGANNLVLNSNVMNINVAEAQGGNGGVFHFANTGTSTLTLLTPTFVNVKSSSSGGIGSFHGTTAYVSATDFSLDKCEASNNGGCLNY